MRVTLPVSTDNVSFKLVVICLMLFVLLLGDGILSFWIPVYLERILASPMKMGLVMAFSSVVGLALDFVLPQLLVQVSVRRMMLMAVGVNILFGMVLLLGIMMPVVAVFLIAVALWGVFYEFVGFAKQSFVAGVIPHPMHASAWGVLGVFIGLAYFLGPLLGEYLGVFGDRILVFAAMSCSVFSLFFFVLLKGRHQGKPAKDFEKINLWSELKHWRVIFTHVWQIIIMSILLRCVDALMWTTGAVYTDMLGDTYSMGKWFLSLYMLPMLFIGLVVGRLHIVNGKKHIAQLLMLAEGALLILLGLVDGLWWQLILVFMVGVVGAMIFPLSEAVYSDIMERMGRQQKHLIGMNSSTASLAYIIGPILSGMLATQVGSKLTFSLMGGVIVVGAVMLLMMTPKKLKMPQVEIREW